MFKFYSLSDPHRSELVIHIIGIGMGEWDTHQTTIDMGMTK